MKGDKEKIYLLGGNGSSVNWWKYSLPYFKNFSAIPLTPPGHDNTKNIPASLDDLAREIIYQTEENNFIIACGVNSLTALRAEVLKPSHFKKIILLSPVGAYLWKRKFVKYLKWKPAAGLVRKYFSHSDFIIRRKLLADFDSSVSEKHSINEILNLIKEGYRNCNSFENYFKIISPHDALDLVEWNKTPVHILWGKHDAVVSCKELAAWEAILSRADLSYKIYDEWNHYPYFFQPESFANEVENYFSSQKNFNKAHTKASRISLAKLSGIKIPESFLIRKNNFDKDHLEKWIEKINGEKLFALRSSNYSEDNTGQSKAGLYKSFIRVNRSDVIEKVQQLLSENYDEVLIQKFIEPEVSGVAFVRNISCEIEWVQGHLSGLVSGEVKPFRSVISKMKGEWERGWNKNMDEAPFTVMLDELVKFLKSCIEKFHYQHSDIEWAWDGDKFYLLQIRPVTVYNWHRFVTSANLDEILPKKVSKLMDHAQRKAANSISRVYALWDGHVIEDNEPFTSIYDDASYINCDLFLSRFKDWGLPSKLFSSEIGGTSPKVPFKFFRFMRNIPRFIKMIYSGRSYLLKIESGILNFENEFEKIKKSNSPARENEYVNWFVRYYLFIVRTNIILKACLSSSGGNFMGKPKTIYANINKNDFPHRIRFESDPAVDRDIINFKPLLPIPKWNKIILLWHKAGLPGMRGKYIEIREWFRDNNMRLFQRLHAELKGTEWFDLSSGIRNKTGSFWQDEEEVFGQENSIVIYPGKAEGIAGEDVLIVDAFESGMFEEYKKAKAVIAKTGGKLSHGAILLRELKKPSAVIGDIDFGELSGKEIFYDNGKINFK
jgi:pimeloyl-ACP methyl ester carboxylesterase